MKGNPGRAGLTLALGLLLAACSSGNAPTWSYAVAPAAAPGGRVTASVGGTAGQALPAPSPAAVASAAPATMAGMAGPSAPAP